MHKNSHDICVFTIIYRASMRSFSPGWPLSQMLLYAMSALAPDLVGMLCDDVITMSVVN